MQETEVPSDFPETLLNCDGYHLELELSTSKRRTGIYVADGINYKRRRDLEKNNTHVMIIDVMAEIMCIINENGNNYSKGQEPTAV